MEKIKGAKILVGLSGGVDSAVTAAVLQRAGAQVEGVFIRGWYPEGMPCTWREDRADAMRAAAHLGIPFTTLDASEEYKEGVIDYLLNEYRAGRTPNPDIMCNREVKFGAFVRYAKERGADGIATGHYARVERSDHGGNTEAQLMRGIDEDKDQSYFLWAVPKQALAMSHFPLGGMRKSEVRALATRLQLPQANRPDSQGICFLGNVSVEEFLKKEFGEEPGTALDEAGKRIGTHNGVLLHTIGSRIVLEDAPPGPWYVLAKSISDNALIVGKKEKAHGGEALNTVINQIKLEQVTIHDSLKPNESLVAQYRYHGPHIQGTFDSDRNIFMPSTPLTEPLASGQSLVLYRDDTLVAGGIMV